MSIVRHNIRFTVIDPICVRMEFSRKDHFRDEPTLFAANRDLPEAPYSCSDEDGVFTLKTSALKIVWHYKYGARPKSGTLEVHQGNEVWKYGKTQKHNLGGVLQSLDDCKEAMPLPDGFLARDGWTVIDDSSAAVLKNGWISADLRSEDYFDFYYFGYGTNYKRALEVLMKLSGKVPMLPRWAMGSWYSRWYFYTSQDYREIVREYETHGYPLDVIVMDMEWHTRGGDRGWGWAGTPGWTGWTWNRELLPDAEALLREFQQKDLKIAMNAHPHDGIRSHEACYNDFMRDMGASTAGGSALEFDAGSRKYMENYFKHAHAPHEKEGCSVWWVDWQQDSIYPFVRGVPGTKHVPWLNHCYFNHMKRDGKRGIAFSRWGGFGDQKHPIHFSGDTTATWEVLAFEIAFNTISGNSGCFFWTHDMGGFCGERQEELYARWLQFGALSAVMRLHSCGEELDRRPWRWAEPFQSSLKTSFRLRSQLMPYLYSAMHDACRDSLPMCKALYLEHPQDESSYRNAQEFYVGKHLLVSPVTAPGTGKKFLAFQKIYVPSGEWCNFFTGERYAAGTHLAAAELNEFPLLVRAGVALPLGSPDKKHMSDMDAELELLCFPSSTPSDTVFTLYEDDGESDVCERGEYAETAIRTLAAPGKIEITVEAVAGKFRGMIVNRSWKLTLRNVRSVQSVQLNGNPVAWELDETAHQLTTSPVSSEGKTLVFTVNFTALDDAGLCREAYERRNAIELSSECRLLLHGKGALRCTDPLTAKKEIIVWPEGLQSFTVSENGSELSGSLQSCGTEPLIFEEKAAMSFTYQDGSCFCFRNSLLFSPGECTLNQAHTSTGGFSI